MIARWRDGADIVYAVRTERKGETAFKRASASVFYRVLRRLADVDMPVDVGDFRLLSRRAADALQSMPEQHRYVRGMVAWMGFETASVGYVRDPRTAGETKYPLGKMIEFAADGILAFSVRPLRIATWLGLLTSFAAFAYALWLIFARITGVIPSVDGWTSLMVLILLLAGVQLTTIGALGSTSAASTRKYGTGRSTSCPRRSARGSDRRGRSADSRAECSGVGRAGRRRPGRLG